MLKLLDKISDKAFDKPEEGTTSAGASLYDININRLDGTPLNLSNYKDKYILFVNVASQCGFTGQYKGLESLYQKHKERLMIIGVPCNQFDSQEPGSAEQISEFCALNYGVRFTLTEKIDVKGNGQHELYQWLTQKQRNGKKSSSVKWNFQKYLVAPKSEFIDFYYSTTSPSSKKITKHFT